MGNYKYVIFDLDGTLLDTGAGIFASLDHAVEALGLTALTETQKRGCIGPPLTKSLPEIYDKNPDVLEKLIAVFRKDYLEKGILNAHEYPGITNLLQALGKQGKKVAVATNKGEHAAKTMLDHFGMTKYLDVIYGADTEGKRTKTDCVNLCLKALDVADNNEAVLIGDSSGDAKGAEEAGIDFIGVTYGFGFENKNDVDKCRNAGTADSVEILGEMLNAK